MHIHFQLENCCIQYLSELVECLIGSTVSFVCVSKETRPLKLLFCVAHYLILAIGYLSEVPMLLFFCTVVSILLEIFCVPLPYEVINCQLCEVYDCKWSVKSMRIHLIDFCNIEMQQVRKHYLLHVGNLNSATVNGSEQEAIIHTCKD